MKYLGAITADKDLTTKEYVDAGDAAFQAKRGQLVRPNLLDNWYFVGGGSQQGGGQFPINQRGATSYSGAVYGIDRWTGEESAISTTLESSGLKLQCTGAIGANTYLFRQTFENAAKYRDAKYTMSVLVDSIQGNFNAAIRDQGAHTIATALPITSSGLYSVTSTVQSDTTDLSFRFMTGASSASSGDYIKIIAVKLELGDTQTLAHQENGVWVLNEIPNYQEQLFRCQTSTAHSADTYSNKPNLVGFQVNPNLLDNWYFVGGGSQQGGGQFPINQRGQTSYSNVNGYTIDRWAIQTTRSLTLGSDGITITPTATNNGRVVVQGLPGIPLLGKTITVSILCTSSGINNVYVSIFANNSYTSAYDTYIPASQNSRTVDGNGVYLLSATVNMRSELITSSRDKLTFGFGFTNTGTIVPSFTVIAAKLEYGSTQTLAHQENGVWVLNEIPNYQKQLKRCQRFFIAFNHAGESYCKPGSGYAKSGTAGLVLLPHPTMRAAPSVTYSGNWAMKDYSNNYCTVSAMSRDVATAVGTSLNITSSSMTSGREYTLTANNDSTANIYLSADL